MSNDDGIKPSRDVAKLKREVLRRWRSLKSERSSWDSHWEDISAHLLPRASRFNSSETNKGAKKNDKIIDGSGTEALRVLAAGMMSGMTSPARPWFKLGISDRELMQYHPVKVWLNDVTELMLRVFQRSNTYMALQKMYEEMGAFGTSASIVTADYKNVIHHHTIPIGEYCAATNFKGEVVTLYRAFRKTVAEIVREFGVQNVSQSVKHAYENGNLDDWVDIVHAIEPRADRDSSKADNLNMPWRSVYFELNSDGRDILRESGFRRFPALVPRWQVTGSDVYGNSPGMDALGDLKQLQHDKFRYAQAVDYLSDPPIQAPSGMKNDVINLLPGGVSFVSMSAQNNMIKNALDVRVDLTHLLSGIQDTRQRIRSSFYADMFLMLSSATNPQMTATEVAERHEEKLLMLGPVTERIKNELLDPLIEITFDYLVEGDVVPPAPKELQGQALNVELIGIIAQAQKSININGVDRFMSSVMSIAQAKPEVLDKLNADKIVDEYAQAHGVNPEIVLPEEQVDALRQQRAQMQQAQAQQAQLLQQADIVQKLAGAKTDQASVLSDIAQQRSA